ncbi:MAG: cytochrome c [Phycisphaerae bacterium]
MDAFVYYPINEFEPLMKGLIIGGMGILHVFLAQFAIGGGMLLLYFQWLAGRGREPHARRFVDGYFRILVLISFVLGALTGVNMWLTSIQISPRTIGMMVDQFHWIWAIEWTFFCVEIVAGYSFLRYARRLSDRGRLTVLAIYCGAAWMSLFWINGILTWQLTPGDWPNGGGVWVAFFNAGFFPSLLYRTAASMAIAALVACITVNTMSELDRDGRNALITRCGHFVLALLAMPALGVWYLSVAPADSRAYVTGGSVAMTMFTAVAVGASALVGLYGLIGLVKQRLYVNGATATLLTALALGATAGGEFVREGIRKPYSIREKLYSNSVSPAGIEELRTKGVTTGDPYPLRLASRYPGDQVRRGALVFRDLCSVCHTVEGMNGLAHLTGSWTLDQMRMNFAQLQHTKPFMPPFAGSPDELEALVQLVTWVNAGKPREWPDAHDAAKRERVSAWLREAGTAPGDFQRYRGLTAVDVQER